MFCTLLKHIPEPVQNMALSFGWSSFGVTVPIVLARLVAIYSIPGFSSSVIKSPGSTITCLNWSYLSKPASKPWNLWMLVAQAGTRGQYVTLQHDCFLLQNLLIMSIGTCFSRYGYFSQLEKFPCEVKLSNDENVKLTVLWFFSHGGIPSGNFRFGKSTTT